MQRRIIVKYDSETGIYTHVSYERYENDIEELKEKIEKLSIQNGDLEDENENFKELLKEIKAYSESDFNDQIIVSAIRNLLKKAEI